MVTTPEKASGVIHWCPFNVDLGIAFPNYLVVERWDALEDPETVGSMIHEMGHLCCTKDIKKREYAFFGWEFAIAVKYALLNEWLLATKDYLVGNSKVGAEFGSEDKESQSDILEEAILLAMKKGYLDAAGSPKRP